ncbi:hypothetical protein BD309DRAFT_568911 [Dichomitus squalens]|nr:hypothetical protein BD309DRAFT_568911 [Dichomitus squalens]
MTKSYAGAGMRTHTSSRRGRASVRGTARTRTRLSVQTSAQLLGYRMCDIYMERAPVAQKSAVRGGRRRREEREALDARSQFCPRLLQIFQRKIYPPLEGTQRCYGCRRRQPVVYRPGNFIMKTALGSPRIHSVHLCGRWVTTAISEESNCGSGSVRTVTASCEGRTRRISPGRRGRDVTRRLDAMSKSHNTCGCVV